MSRRIVTSVPILNIIGNVSSANATAYNLDGCDQAIFSIDKIGNNATIYLDFDLNGDNTVVVQESFTADDQKVLDDPCGKVKAWCSGATAGEGAKVYMRKVYWQQR